jgi:hypothetical protein
VTATESLVNHRHGRNRSRARSPISSSDRIAKETDPLIRRRDLAIDSVFLDEISELRSKKMKSRFQPLGFRGLRQESRSILPILALMRAFDEDPEVTVVLPALMPCKKRKTLPGRLVRASWLAHRPARAVERRADGLEGRGVPFPKSGRRAFDEIEPAAAPAWPDAK